jgi:predicted protein tyrosine phosphatase
MLLIAYAIGMKMGRFVFDLKVTGYDEGTRLMVAGWPTHAISVTRRVMPDMRCDHLQIFMDDILRPTPGLILPDMNHLYQILNFTHNLDLTDRVLVHCHQGINRSTAAAIGILIQHGVEYIDAYWQIAAQRPNMAPNRLLISYIDRNFGLAGKLNRLVLRPTRVPPGRISSAGSYKSV